MMKKKTIDRCMLWVLLAGTLLLAMYTCGKEKEYADRMQLLEMMEYHSSQKGLVTETNGRITIRQ